MLIILDKDGTLVEPASGKTFVQHPEDQVLLPGVTDRVSELHAQGHTLVIASNQGGVGKYKSLEDAIAEMRYCLGLLPQIESAMFCPDFDGKECFWVGRTLVQPSKCFAFPFFNYRKPNPGMLLHAMGQFEGSTKRFNREDAIMVGDRDEDSEAAKAAGIRFIDAAEWRQNGIQSLHPLLAQTAD